MVCLGKGAKVGDFDPVAVTLRKHLAAPSLPHDVSHGGALEVISLCNSSKTGLTFTTPDYNGHII